MLNSEDFARSTQGPPPDLAGLRYVRDEGPVIRRKRAGKGFFYVDSKAIGSPIRRS